MCLVCAVWGTCISVRFLGCGVMVFGDIPLHILLHIPNETVYHQKMWLKDCSTGDLLGENAVLGLTADGKNTIDALALVLSYLHPHVSPHTRAHTQTHCCKLLRDLEDC